MVVVAVSALVAFMTISLLYFYAYDWFTEKNNKRPEYLPENINMP
jgi:hypothetical protein